MNIVDRAIIFATKAHSGKLRKGSQLPYIVHPLEALAIVATITSDKELMAAAALHDVVEDTRYEIYEIRHEFGDRVADLVDSETSRDIEGVSHVDSWHQRKQVAIDRLAAASRDSQIVALGDKLSNMRLIAHDYATLGDEIWNRFNVKNKADHAWRYHSLVNALSDLSGTEAYKEFCMLVEKVFGI